MVENRYQATDQQVRHRLTEDGWVHTPLSFAPEDFDVYGHLNNARLPRHVEQGRMALLERLGLSGLLGSSDGGDLRVVHAEYRYLGQIWPGEKWEVYSHAEPCPDAASESGAFHSSHFVTAPGRGPAARALIRAAAPSQSRADWIQDGLKEGGNSLDLVIDPLDCSQGSLHYSNAPDYFEQGRKAMQKSLGLADEVLDAQGNPLVVVASRYLFTSHVRPGDKVRIYSRWVPIHNHVARARLDQVMTHRDIVIARSASDHSFIDKETKKPLRKPERLIAKIFS